MRGLRDAIVCFTAAVVCLLPHISQASPQRYSVDTNASELTIHVFRGGAFSKMGHDHLLSPRQWEGTLDVDPQAPENTQVALRVFASTLEDQHPGLSESDRAKVDEQTRSSVLEAQRYPVIEFISERVVMSAAEEGAGAPWQGTLFGVLTLHGHTRRLSIPFRAGVGEGAVSATGKVMLSLRDFGIKAPSAGLGTVKTKDEVWVHFHLKTQPRVN